MSNAVYSFLLRYPNFLFFCDVCKCEAVPASSEMRELKETVEKIAKAICPAPFTAEPELNDSVTGVDADESSSSGGPWTVVGQRKSN